MSRARADRSADWPPQHGDTFTPTDLEPGNPHELLAERVEAAVRYQFRSATNPQVDAVTKDVTKAAIEYAEFWQTSHPRRQVPR